MYESQREKGACSDSLGQKKSTEEGMFAKKLEGLSISRSSAANGGGGALMSREQQFLNAVRIQAA